MARVTKHFVMQLWRKHKQCLMDIFTCMNRIRNGEDGGVVDSQNQSPPWEYLHLQNIFFFAWSRVL
jgi:hypothetical protein